jgi:ABC-type transport system involved in multi-copper enzyme maturation permease subunit
MKGFVAMVSVGLRQLLGGKRMIVFALLGAIPGVIAFLTTRDLTPAAVVSTFHEGPIGTLFFIVIPITSLVLGAGALGDERRDSTLSFLTLRPRPRWVISAAKIASAWLATTMIVGLSAAIAAGVVGWRIGDWTLIAPAVLGAAIAALGYTSVFTVLGFLTRRAVLLGLIYVFIWENGITFGAASLANVSLFRVGVSAHVGLVPESRDILSEVLGTVTPGAGGAVAKGLVIAAVAGLIAASMLKRRDHSA